jgi:hypothetical protein
VDYAYAREKLVELQEAAMEQDDAVVTVIHPHSADQERKRNARHRLHAAVAVAEEVLKRIDPRMARALLQVTDARVFVDIAARGIGLIDAREELEEKLGPTGPSLNASSLHPAVWRVAVPFWDLGHHNNALDTAGKAIVAMIEDKVGHRIQDGTQLVREVFSADDPKPDRPRLRFPDVDRATDPKTWQARHDGARDFGAGCFQAIRNVAAHARPGEEPDQQEALEQLAALSVLARWVEQCEVEQHAYTLDDLQREASEN